MNANLIGLIVWLLLSLPGAAKASPQNPNTDWFKYAKYGVFMHFLPADPKSLALIEQFDVESLARQLETVGARYFVLTLGQNSGYFNSPNAAYNRYTGYAPETTFSDAQGRRKHSFSEPHNAQWVGHCGCDAPSVRAFLPFRIEPRCSRPGGANPRNLLPFSKYRRNRMCNGCLRHKHCPGRH
jgi:hypothetical protein